MFIRRPRQALCALVLLALACLPGSAASLGESLPESSANAAKNVLLLYSYGYGGKGMGIYDQSLLKALAAQGVSVSQLFFEHLDLERNQGDSAYRARLRELLERKYRDRQIDVIVTAQQPALHFLLNEGVRIAPEAPVITVQSPRPAASAVGERRLISLLSSFDIAGTLDYAFKLFPETQRIFIVSGASVADRIMAAQARRIAEASARDVEVETTEQLTLPALLERVQRLPAHTVILFTQYNRDAAGRVTVAYEVEGLIARQAKAPVFGLYDFNLINGGIGGSVVSVEQLGVEVAQLVVDLTQGKRQMTEPVSSATMDVVPMFDWTRIEQSGGNSSRLPPHSVFVNRVPTLWQLYKPYVVGLIIFIVAQSALIGALLVSRRRRQRAERSLRESEENLSITLHSIGDAVIATDASGCVTRMNPIAERLCGWTLPEAAGRPLHEVFRIVNADTRETVADPVQRVLAHGATVGLAEHTLLLARDGDEYPIADSAAPIRNAAGAIVGVVLVFSDVSERYRAESALRESGEKFRALAESMPQIVWITTAGGANTYFNQQWVAYTGLDLDASSGQGWIKPFHPEDRPRALKAWQDAVANELPYVVDCRLRRSDGRYRWWLMRGVPVRDPHGAVEHWFGTCTDIHEIRELNAHLEARIRERTAELEISNQSLQGAKEAAEAANVAKSVFLSNMSHEIRTPMNGILGMAHILRREGVTPTQARRLETIDGSARHLLAIINDVLDISKIEAGKFTVEELPLVVANLLDTVAAIVGERARARNIRLQVEAGPMPAPLLGDPTRLQQALLNYVGNAIKFTEVGSVSLRAALQEESAESVLVRFEVEDTGIGIAAEALPRLFAAFEQSDNSTTRKYGGTGLGLAITRRLAELMGGGAGVDSQPGAGSRFWFTVRLRKASADAAGPGAAASDAEKEIGQRFCGRRILIVDDEAINREVARTLLTDAGLAVDLAEDGTGAIVMARQTDYAAILMDMQMPEVNGLEATREIRALAGYHEVPIVAMTANAFAEDTARCIAAGMNDVLIKPFAPDALFAIVLRWLDRQPARCVPNDGERRADRRSGASGASSRERAER